MAMLDYDGSTDARQLSRLNAKLLNTFRRVEMSQDPIKPLQNGRSRANYIATLQKLLCYFSRVSENDRWLPLLPSPLSPQQQPRRQKDRGDKRMFAITSAQLAAWTQVQRLATAAIAPLQHRLDSAIAKQISDLALLDRALLVFVIELLQHRLPEREFDSAIVSFAAVLAWDTVAQTWKLMSSYSSLLSHLIYDCQLIALQYCMYDVSISQPPRDLTISLTAFRDS
jgi:hypothetical protein